MANSSSVTLLGRTIDPVFLRYFAASAVALGADLGAFLILLRLAVPAPASMVVSYSLGIVVHWLLATRAVFNAATAAAGPERTHQKRLFIATALLGLALTSAIADAAAMIAVDPRLAKLAAAAVSFMATWSLRSRVVFAGDFATRRS